MRIDQNAVFKLSVAAVLVAMTVGLAAFSGAAHRPEVPAAPAVREGAPAQRDQSLIGLSVAADAKPDAVVDMTY